MTDSEFTEFQDDFYDLIEKYSVKIVDCDSSQFNEICGVRNTIIDLIDKINSWQRYLIML